MHVIYEIRNMIKITIKITYVSVLIINFYTNLDCIDCTLVEKSQFSFFAFFNNLHLKFFKSCPCILEFFYLRAFSILCAKSLQIRFFFFFFSYLNMRFYFDSSFSLIFFLCVSHVDADRRQARHHRHLLLVASD